MIPALHPLLVMAGLDPGIHSVTYQLNPGRDQTISDFLSR